MAGHSEVISVKIMKRWPYILLICIILLINFVYTTPIEPLQLPDFPQQIHYIDDHPLPGGQLESLLNANFTPNQIVTGSGLPTNPAFSGISGGFSMLGDTIGRIGNALGSALGTAIKGTWAPDIFTSNGCNENLLIFQVFLGLLPYF